MCGSHQAHESTSEVTNKQLTTNQYYTFLLLNTVLSDYFQVDNLMDTHIPVNLTIKTFEWNQHYIYKPMYNQPWLVIKATDRLIFDWGGRGGCVKKRKNRYRGKPSNSENNLHMQMEQFSIKM